MKLLGRSGEELKVALAGGPEALKALIEEGQRLNPITTELAKQADAFNDNLAKIGITIKSSTYPALNSLLKPANELLDIASSKEVGGGLSGLFASLFGNADLNAKQLEDPGKALQALTKKIDVLKQRANLDIGGVQLKLAEAQKQLLQQEQRKRALAGTDGLDEGREGRGRVKTNIHITTDEEIAAAKKAEQVAEAARKRAKDFIADLEKQRDTLGVSEEAQKSYEASVLSTSLAAGKERDAFIASTKARIDDIKAQKELDEFRQQINKNIEEGVEAQKKWTEAIQDSVEKEQELLDEQLKANEVFGKTKAEIIDLTIARKEAALAAGEAAHLTEEETSALSQQIEVLKRRKNAVVKGETLEKDKKAYEDFFSSVESAGKEAFRNFGEEGVSVTERLKNALKESVYDMLYQLTVKKWLINIETAISGSDGGESSGFNWASLIGMFGGGGEASAADFYAKGGAFEGGVERYATGGIVSRPTLFRMANGAGLMGEAGPEGILPLQRMGDGRLGVSTSGLDGSAGITIIQNNTFQGGADKATLAAWAAQVKQETMRAVSSEIARNGPMAKVVRSA
jgi:lambda family phage tail tape measure protein